MNTDKLKELLAAATPGPWGVLNEGDHENPWCVTSESLPYVATMNWAGSGREEANAALIVAAVNALPSLIARLEAAEGLRDEVERLAAKANIKTAQGVQCLMIPAGELVAALTAYDQEKAREHG